MKAKIIVVAGPTASGKTQLGINIAKAVGGEIISADSMQVYRNMPVATAAPTDEEKSQVPHHLVEFMDNDETFSVAKWCELAKMKAEEIISRGNVPVIVGGTGLFIDSFVDNITFEDVEINEQLRSSLMQKNERELYDELLKVDPDGAKNIHINNKKRVVRALELYYSGTSKTTQNVNSKKIPSPYETLYFVLSFKNRDFLYDRINKRVDLMVQNGLVQEARNVLACSQATSAQAIGHKELLPYINGECSFEQSIERLKQKTRNYAKRQITWFKRRNDAVFIYPDEVGYNKASDFAIRKSREFINGKDR